MVAFLIPGYRASSDGSATSARIQPYSANPSYWQYQNKPVLLLGGSSEDNLFQYTSPDLDDELDHLRQFGGNYLRCTMSGRDIGNVYPFYLDTATQKYDLARWNDEYWKRIDYFLKATQARDIIVQIEIWATYDFYTRPGTLLDGLTAWDRNPFNPGNNVNYTEAESGLYEIFRSTHGTLINPFFHTVLPLRQPFDFNTRPVVLEYQQKFVDKLLSISLNYDHVLYCIDNETNADPKWPIYWSQYIRKAASEKGTGIEVTEMWDTYDPTDGAVEGAIHESPAVHFFTLRSGVSNTLYDPDNYSYLEISNHNAQTGETHFKTGYYVWKKIQESGVIRPVNNVKIYGAGAGGWNGSSQDGMERFWRNVFAGSAAVRFHRQTAGLGNTDVALAHVKSMRMLTDSIDMFSCRPANELLSERDENEAYCLAGGQGEYVLFFPSGGKISLNIKSGSYEVRWLDVRSSEWLEPTTLEFPEAIEAPDDRIWAVRIVESR